MWDVWGVGRVRCVGVHARAQKGTTQLSDGFKSWRRFSVIPEAETVSVNLVQVNKSKIKKGV